MPWWGSRPGAWAVPTAFLVGVGNGLLWWQVVRIAVLRGHPRWSRVPATPNAVAVVCALMFGAGTVTETGTVDPQISQAKTLERVEAQITREPVLFLAGYNSHYGSEPGGKTPPLLGYSYAGSTPDGTPQPYSPTDTHQSLQASAQRLAAQVRQLRRRSGRPLALLA